MATIIRNGQQIELTAEEIRQIRIEEHTNDIRYEVEEAVTRAEEDDIISFDSWADCPCADYENRDDARSDFIEYIVEHILDEEDISEEHAPLGFRFVPDYDSEVTDTAEEFGYLKGE